VPAVQECTNTNVATLGRPNVEYRVGEGNTRLHDFIPDISTVQTLMECPSQVQHGIGLTRAIELEFKLGLQLQPLKVFGSASRMMWSNKN